MPLPISSEFTVSRLAPEEEKAIEEREVGKRRKREEEKEVLQANEVAGGARRTATAMDAAHGYKVFRTGILSTALRDSNQI